jgi:arylsulfatase A-like enzyme
LAGAKSVNVILISLDTQRAQNLSCYGHFRLTTPHVDRVAAEGTIFNECISTFIPTHPGHTTMFTGTDPMRHQIIAQGQQTEVDENLLTLPQILQQQGYFTAAADNLGRWFKRGFEVYESYKWDTTPNQPWRKAEAVSEKALAVLEQAANQDKPFFLFLHYWDPHTPYLPPPPFDKMFYTGDPRDPNNASMDAVWHFDPFKWYFNQWMPGVTDIEYPKALYDSETAYMDATLAQLFTRLDELRLSDETFLVITADHGEELDEHEGCWFDHHGLYETNLRVPLILRYPGKIPAGKRVDGMVTLMDIAPTILDFLGLGELAEQNGMLGNSALPLVNASSSSGLRDTLFLTECTWMKHKGVRTNAWKLIVDVPSAANPNESGTPAVYHKPPVELYHHKTDPWEQKNVADEHPEVVAELRARLDEWIQERKAQTGLPDPHEFQDVTLRQIGKMETAVPAEQKLGRNA